MLKVVDKSARLRASQAGNSARILVVEDDPDISELLVGIFRAEGYQAIPAHDVPTALKLLRSIRADAITLDITMPECDGSQLLRKIKRSPATRSIPVIVVSAYCDHLDDGDRPLAAAILQKPFELSRLLQITARILASISA